MKPIRIALTGNPNSGKTSLFNHLTGAMQHVGNWGGVTVEVKEGTARAGDRKVKIVDLPGTYSLSAYSLEEKVARDYLVNEKPDIVVDVIDASNLERNLYLALQLMELGIRPLLALNMWDEVERKGLAIDTAKLSKLLGVQIVTTVGKSGTGVNEMLARAVEIATEGQQPYSRPLGTVPWELGREIERMATMEPLSSATRYPPQWIASKLLEYDRQVEEHVESLPGGQSVLSVRDSAATRIEQALGDTPEELIAEARYGYISGAVKETVRTTRPDRMEISDRIDTVLTHRLWAYPVFLAFMWVLFQATFRLGAYPMEWIELFFGRLGELAAAHLPPGNFRGLITEGIIGGVGGVAVFLPNILILFFGISIMEDTGYMARTAFIMDKFMHKMGLHGKSFIPMLMGLGCSVPAIMATRTLESDKDRIRTILLTPLISCSARLPVYVLFAGAFFPNNAGNVVFLFQFVLGFTAFFLMGIALKKTLFRGEDYPFVMELPPYRLPTLRSVAIHMWHKAEHYLKKMGGVVLVFSVILWFAGAYPKSPRIEQRYERKIEAVVARVDLSAKTKQERVQVLKGEQQSVVMSHTYIGKVGKALAPVVKPLGFTWKAAVSLVTGFVAKEVVVSTMGVLYAVGESDAESESLRTEIAQDFSPLSAVAFMLFVLLYTPCCVAFVTAVRELKNWRWSTFSLVYQLVLAWSAAFVVYQGGKLLGLE